MLGESRECRKSAGISQSLPLNLRAGGFKGLDWAGTAEAEAVVGTIDLGTAERGVDRDGWQSG